MKDVEHPVQRESNWRSRQSSLLRVAHRWLAPRSDKAQISSSVSDSAPRNESRVFHPIDTAELASEGRTEDAVPSMIEVELRAALERSNRLVDEVNHRIMNNLAMIGAIMTSEARDFTDENVRSAFERLRNRIFAVGSLYRTLSHVKLTETIRADSYLETVLRDTIAASARTSLDLRTDISLAPVLLPKTIALPLGLIMNELVMNSLKYAFNNRDSGVVGITLCESAGALRLVVCDDGCGVDPAEHVSSGLGQKLMEGFAAQLKGTLRRETGDHGTTQTLTFPQAATAAVE